MTTPADHRLSRQLQEAAKALRADLQNRYGKPVGLVFLVVPFDQPAAETELQYISNCERAEAVNMLRMLFKRWQLDLPDIPFHEKQ